PVLKDGPTPLRGNARERAWTIVRCSVVHWPQQPVLKTGLHRFAETPVNGRGPYPSSVMPRRDSGRLLARPKNRLPTFSAHTAAPRPLSRTPAGSRASNRHASIAPRTTWAHGPPTWGAPRIHTHRSIPAPPTPEQASCLLATVPCPTPP